MSTLEALQESIIVKNAPDIPGLFFRGFRGDDDFPLMSAIIHECKEEDQEERTETVEEIATGYKHLVNCDPYKDMIFAQVDEQTIAYSRVSWHKETNGNMIYVHFGYILPEWRRNGIGRSILHYNQAHLRQIAAGHENGYPRFFEAYSSDTETANTKLLTSEGFSTTRHFFRMLRPDLENIPDSPMPDGLEVRPVEPDHYQLICDASNEAFRDHWGYSNDWQLTVQELTDSPYFDPSLWKVAWDGDQVVGTVLTYINKQENQEYNRKRGWTEDICVRRPWRRRGLASSLIAQSLRMLKDLGMEQASLGVDTQNLSGALRLYERMGYKPDKRYDTYRKEF